MTTAVIKTLAAMLPGSEFVVLSPYYKADLQLIDKFQNTHLVKGSPLQLLFCIFPLSVMDRLFRFTGLGFRKLSEATRQLGSCDVIVDVAGISFSDGREKLLPYNVLTIWPAMLMGVPVAKLSQAMGPFSNWMNRKLARWMLNKCSLVVARGKQSGENISSIGIDGLVCPDVSFLLADFKTDDEETEALDNYLQFGTSSRQ